MLVNTYPNRGKTFVKGKGVYLYDQKGQPYLDMMSNYGVNIFGYKHPKITQALKDQLDQLITLHGSFNNQTRTRAATKLVRRCNGKLSQVCFTNSGAEAVEAALKFARVATGKSKVIAMRGSYHGKTLGALSVTESKKYRVGLNDCLTEVAFIKYGELDQLRNKLDESVAAVILEPIQGESGIIVPPDGYLKQVEELCQARQVLLILDEIQTGIGRTGQFLASHDTGIKPDIICLGKGLAGGIPVGAALVSLEVGEKIPKAYQTSTFGGNPIACRGIIEVLSLVDEKLLNNIVKLGEYFINQLNNINHKRIVEVRGKGLMIGVEVKGDRNQILKNMQNQKILVSPAEDQVVRFLPPYIITKKDINRTIQALERSL